MTNSGFRSCQFRVLLFDFVLTKWSWARVAHFLSFLFDTDFFLSLMFPRFLSLFLSLSLSCYLSARLPVVSLPSISSGAGSKFCQMWDNTCSIGARSSWRIVSGSLWVGRKWRSLTVFKQSKVFSIEVTNLGKGLRSVLTYWAACW